MQWLRKKAKRDRSMEALLKENERLELEVSNLKLANEEARKTIERLNAMIPGDACSSAQ